MNRKFQFSLRSVCSLLVLVAIFATISRHGYIHWYLPQQPIRWTDFSKEELAAARAVGRPVLLVVVADWDLSSSYSLIGLRLDTPEIRRLLYIHRVHCLRADITDENSQLIQDLEESLAASPVGVPQVLLLPTDPSEKPESISPLSALQETRAAVQDWLE